MKLVRIAAVVVVAATATLWGATSAQAGLEQPSITLTISPTTGPLGTEIAASGQCFEDGDSSCDGVIVTLLDPEGEPVDADSVFENDTDYALTVTVPIAGLCGEYTVLAEGDENEEIIVDTSAVFTVPCPDTTTTPEESSSTTESVAATGETRPTFTG